MNASSTLKIFVHTNTLTQDYDYKSFTECFEFRYFCKTDE